MGLRLREEIIKDIEKVEREVTEILNSNDGGIKEKLFVLYDELDKLYNELDNVSEKEVVDKKDVG